LRTPSVTDSTGGAISEQQARERGRMVKVADQAAEIAFENGLKVSESITKSLLPTPSVAHLRNHDEPVEEYLARRDKFENGEYKGMPGVSLGVAVRLLPTPTATDQRDGTVLRSIAIENLANGKNRGINLNHLTEAIGVDWEEGETFSMVDGKLVKDLLPTPMSRDWKGDTQPHYRNGVLQTDSIERAVLHSGEVLLGTPRTSMANGHSAAEVEAGAPKARIEDQVMITNWGKFEPAIRRWEAVLGRPAPAPTKPDGRDGAHRLSSSFTEWMMGLPEGWITDCGLKRNQELKACGNGVVPQQAMLALSILLEGVL